MIVQFNKIMSCACADKIKQLVCTIHTTPVFQVELEKDGRE